MAVEAVEGGVVAVAGVRGVALDALTAVSARYGGVQTLARAVPADALLLVHLALQVQRHAVHPQAAHAAQERPQGTVGSALAGKRGKREFLLSVRSQAFEQTKMAAR